jgi:hypothetical protein
MDFPYWNYSEYFNIKKKFTSRGPANDRLNVGLVPFVSRQGEKIGSCLLSNILCVEWGRQGTIWLRFDGWFPFYRCLGRWFVEVFNLFDGMVVYGSSYADCSFTWILRVCYFLHLWSMRVFQKWMDIFGWIRSFESLPFFILEYFCLLDGLCKPRWSIRWLKTFWRVLGKSGVEVRFLQNVYWFAFVTRSLQWSSQLVHVVLTLKTHYFVKSQTWY